MVAYIKELDEEQIDEPEFKPKPETETETKTKTLPWLVILTEILSRLPVSTLVRFKTVAKQWFLELSKPDFHKLHYSRLSNDALIFLTSRFNPTSCTIVNASRLTLHLPSVPADFDNALYGVDSCRGIMCVMTDPGHFHIWNPATRFHRKVQPATDGGVVTAYGFGYSSVHSDYRIICFVRPPGIRWFSTQTVRWNTHILDSTETETETVLEKWGVSCAGVWVEDGIFFCLGDNYFGGLIRVALNNIDITTISFPEDMYDYQIYNINNVNSSLLLFGITKNYLTSEVWRVDEVGDNYSWVKLTTVDSVFPLHYLGNNEWLIQYRGEQLRRGSLDEKEPTSTLAMPFAVIIDFARGYKESLFEFDLGDDNNSDK